MTIATIFGGMNRPLILMDHMIPGTACSKRSNLIFPVIRDFIQQMYYSRSLDVPGENWAVLMETCPVLKYSCLSTCMRPRIGLLTAYLILTTRFVRNK